MRRVGVGKHRFLSLLENCNGFVTRIFLHNAVGLGNGLGEIHRLDRKERKYK